MGITHQWIREPGIRLQGTRPLDRAKVQAPCIVSVPSGGYRLFYTGAGPEKPFENCQGTILSAYSDDGLNFQVEEGIRISPQPELAHMSLRVLAPTVAKCDDGRWRMYFESRGDASRPTVICSAVSTDMLHWELEDGIRLEGFQGVGGPRHLFLPDGRSRLYCFASEKESAGTGNEERIRQSVVSAISNDGLNFELEPGYRLRDNQAEYDTAGITAAEVIAPRNAGDEWTMFYSAWQDVPKGTEAPLHPSRNPEFATSGAGQVDFAAASIATDMAGYRSRICVASSPDGLNWSDAKCVIEGDGYDAEGPDAVHAEDMSLIEIGDGKYRMYYAACDRSGSWTIVSAVTTALP